MSDCMLLTRKNCLECSCENYNICGKLNLNDSNIDLHNCGATDINISSESLSPGQKKRCYSICDICSEFEFSKRSSETFENSENDSSSFSEE